MRLVQFRHLLAVAETGSLRAAARKLRCTQPTLTKSIRHLEQELGVAVFQRTPHGVVLTEQGQVVLLRAWGIMAEVQKLEEEVAKLHGDEIGTIRLGVSPAAELSIVPPALAAFHRNWPAVQVVLTGALYPLGLTELREGRLDLLIGPMPRDPVGGNLVVETLFDTPTIIVSRANNPRASATSLAELVDELWLIHGPADGPSSLYAEAFRTAALTQPRAFARSHALAATLEILRRNDCFCVLSELLFRHVAPAGELVQVPVCENLPAQTLALMYRANVAQPSAFEALLRAIRSRACAVTDAPT